MTTGAIRSARIPMDPSDPVAVIALGCEGGKECPGIQEVLCSCEDPIHRHPAMICGYCGRAADAHFIAGEFWTQARRVKELLASYRYPLTQLSPTP